jgi:hypothetical protein
VTGAVRVSIIEALFFRDYGKFSLG